MKIIKAKDVVLVALLIISILLNGFLYRQTRSYYSRIYAIELDPLGLSYFQNDREQKAIEQPIVVFFGDSRAAQWTTPTMGGYTFINRGIGDQTSVQVANRFDYHIKPLRPKVVIVQVGINDLKTIPLFPERKREIVSNCEANIQKIVQDSLNLKAMVILTTVFPTGKVSFPRSLVWSDDVDKAIEEVNTYIIGLSNENVIVFDSATLLSNPNGKTKPEYVYDLLHLNTGGYDTLNLELVKILERIK